MHALRSPIRAALIASLATGVLLVVPGVVHGAAAAEPPVCPLPFAVELDQNSSIELDADGHCLDPEGKELTYSTGIEPSHGSLDFAQPGVITYTPVSDYFGFDYFSFVASDPDGEKSDEVGVPVTVWRLTNSPPICATPLTASVTTGSSLALTPDLACSDPDGDPLTFSLVKAPSHGALSAASPSGPFAYTPDAGFLGTDTIEFQAQDGREASNVATLTITVAAPAVPQSPPASPPPAGLPPAVQAADLAAPALDLQRAGAGKLRRLRTRGLRLRLASSESSTIAVELSIARKAARRLGIDRRATGRVVIGRVTRSVTAGETAFTVKLRARARKRLRRAQRVVLRVTVTAIDAAGNQARDVLLLTVRR